MGDVKKLDNIGKEKSELLAKINDNAQQLEKDNLLQTKPEQPGKKEEVSGETKPEEKKAQDDAAEVKYEGKSVEDLIKMNQEAQKKITELAQNKPEDGDKKVKETGTSEKAYAVDEDSIKLFKDLFNVPEKKSDDAPAPVAVKNDNEEDDSSNEGQLAAKISALTKIIMEDKQEATLNRNIELERKAAKETLKSDRVLPWSDKVEDMLEELVFANIPALKSQKGGYIIGHTLLKGLLAKDSVAVSASEGEADPKVAGPSNTAPAPEYDLSKETDLAKFRKNLVKKTGEIRNYNR